MECCYSRTDEEGGLPQLISSLWSQTGFAGQNHSSSSSKAPAPKEDLDAVERRSREVYERHLKAAAAAGSPTLLMYCLSEMGVDKARRRARQVPNNSPLGVPFETDLVVGKVLFLHKSASGKKHCHTDHFQGRKRQWELRFQFRFKRALRNRFFVGVMPQELDLDQETSQTSRLAMKAALSLVPWEAYFAWGDRKEASKLPDRELASCVTDLSACDMVIWTPPDKVVPTLSGDLLNVGEASGQNLQRRQMGIRPYAQAVNDIAKNLTPEDTLTVAVWGFSHFVDVIGWQLHLNRLFGAVPVTRFWGNSPAHFVAYELEDEPDGTPSKRHLESKKEYFVDFLVFSNVVQNDELPSKYIFEDAWPQEDKDRQNFDLREVRSKSLMSGGSRDSKSSSGSASGAAWGASGTTAPPDRSTSGLMSGFIDRLRWIPAATCANDEPRPYASP